MMYNPATRSRLVLNDFTSYLVANPGTKVKLRNGDIVVPVWKPAEDDTCEDCFYSKLGDMNQYCWEPNGTSVTSNKYDMMEIA